MTKFTVNAIIRGAQLTAVGTYRALQNPRLFQAKYFRQAATAILAGLIIQLFLTIPVFILRVALHVLSFISRYDFSGWDERITESLEYISKSVLQTSFFFVLLMRYITPALDEMFMKSIAWTDHTYNVKHKSESPSTPRSMYCHNLNQYPRNQNASITSFRNTINSATKYCHAAVIRGSISLLVYALTYTPVIGPFVLPAASFHTFNKSVGIGPALFIFGTGFFLPKWMIVTFLQSYFSSRTLMRTLLEPYFNRIPFTRAQKAAWFRDRSGVLFGFSFAFYFLIKLPIVGILAFGIAEASTAYLVTKITDPPPAPSTLFLKNFSTIRSIANAPDVAKTRNTSNTSNKSNLSRPYFSESSSILSIDGASPNMLGATAFVLSSSDPTDEYISSQILWKNKSKFLAHPIHMWDELVSSSSMVSLRSLYNFNRVGSPDGESCSTAVPRSR